MKRMRGRSHQRGGGGNGGGGGPRGNYGGNIPLNRNHVFDSSGPDLRIRGTAQQLFEKYLQLGRDATGSGDRVMAESYFQYAEHYFRILNAINQAAQQNTQGGQQQAPYQGSQHTNAAGHYIGHRRHERDQDRELGDGDEPVTVNGQGGQPSGFGDQPAVDVPTAEDVTR